MKFYGFNCVPGVLRRKSLSTKPKDPTESHRDTPMDPARGKKKKSSPLNIQLQEGQIEKLRRGHLNGHLQPALGKLRLIFGFR